MICASLIFFSPDWPHRLKARVLGRREPPSEPVTGEGDDVSPSRRVIAAAALALVFVLAQFATPLRHWAYPGNVRWNDEGYRFSWRVMLTEKTGHVRFRVTLPTLAETRLVYPEDYLTSLQTERMAYQPDMILATAAPDCRRLQEPRRSRRGPRRRIRLVQRATSGQVRRPRRRSREDRARHLAEEMGLACAGRRLTYLMLSPSVSLNPTATDSRLTTSVLRLTCSSDSLS